MGLLLEKLGEYLVKSRVNKLKAYCSDNNLKLPQACNKQELIETILNYRDDQIYRWSQLALAIPDHSRTSSAREGIQRKLSGLP